MSTELTVLALAGLLQVFQFVLMAVPANIQLGPHVTGGPRDDAPVVTGMAGRLHRAMNNHFEGLILFTIACTVITLSNQSTSFTAGCAYTYVVARFAYIPAYAFGLSPWRSAIWFVGFLATTFMLIAALL